MFKEAAEVLIKLWTSWSLLIGANLVFVLLWFVPLSPVLDKGVQQILNNYRGYIGFGALVLVLVTTVRIVIASTLFASNMISVWNKRRPRIKANKKEQEINLLRLPYLEGSNRELLKTLLENKQQQFSMPASNDQSWLGTYADIVTSSIGIPYIEYKIKPWVWKYLNANPSVLELEETGENETSSQA